MFTEFSYYQILGLPILLYIGILGFIFLLSAGVIGYLSYTGKTKIPVKTHKLIAGIGILLGLIHGTLAVLTYL
jgi:hypothetical protein